MAMAKPPKKPKPKEIETEPGAWERFEHAVDAAVKSGPKHRMAPKPRKSKGPSVQPNPSKARSTKK